MYRCRNVAACAFLVTSMFACVGDDTDEVSATLKSGGIRGAIFTTLADGTRVNANIYAAKTDVYLDGGPGPNAPPGAAALDTGDYFFQVTDPSGKTLLSQDHISCRKIHVGASGFITQVYGGTNYVKVGGAWTAQPCLHAQGTDHDYGSLGAITVQLMPYADTPNPGGEYKAWVTPVARYTGNPAYVPGPNATSLDDVGWSGGNAHGFRTSFSKTDNFKIKAVTPPPPPAPVCGNGVMEGSEGCDDGNTANGDGCSATCTVETPPPPPSPVCGNGVMETGEECDDGNTTSGDGCSSTCTVETPPPPPPPAPCCGNGMVEPGEQCDDGNTVDGDGCSASCAIETVCANPDTVSVP